VLLSAGVRRLQIHLMKRVAPPLGLLRVSMSFTLTAGFAGLAAFFAIVPSS